MHLNFFIMMSLIFTSIGEAKTTSYPNYQPKNFNYLKGKMKGFDDKLLTMHFTLYQGYVKNTNLILRTLKEMADNGQDRTIGYGALKRRMGWEFDGMILHELYFENLGGVEPLPKKSALYQEIENNFGSYDEWIQEFKATGLIRGIGWVILYRDPKDGHLHTVWINEHDHGHLAGGTPLLVMDVWEHAYLIEYGLDRGAYIDAFIKNIDWNAPMERFEKVVSGSGR